MVLAGITFAYSERQKEQEAAQLKREKEKETAQLLREKEQEMARVESQKERERAQLKREREQELARQENQKQQEEARITKTKTLEREAEVERNISRLDAEIAGRLSHVAAFAQIHISRNGGDTSGIFPPSAIPYMQLANKPDGKVGRDGNVFSDYATRSLRSLMWELSVLLPDKERAEIKEAYDSLQMLLQLDAIDAEAPENNRRAKAIPNERNLDIAEEDKDLIRRMLSGQLETGRNMLAISLPERLNKNRWGCPFDVLNFPLGRVVAATDKDSFNRKIKKRDEIDKEIQRKYDERMEKIKKGASPPCLLAPVFYDLD